MKVKRITKVGKARVINLCVHKNHTFITKNGIVTHNCDHLSPDAQAAFRGFIDDYSANCRFIFTGNYKNKIIPPLIDRLQNIDFSSFDRKDIAGQMYKRLTHILDDQNISYTKEDLVKVMYTYFPKMRSMISFLQTSCTSGTLDPNGSLDNVDLFDDVLKSLNGDYHELYAKVGSLTAPDNMYSFLYNNVTKYFPNAEPKAILIAAKYQHMASIVRDKHLNLMACLTELKQ